MAPLASWLGAWLRPEKPAACFVTWRLARGQPPLQPRERQVVFDTVLGGNGQRYELLALVVMDDHVHALVRGAPAAAAPLAASWKASASHQLQRVHRRSANLWADGVQLTAVDSEERVRALANCILGNPWKRWPFLPGYAWVYHGIEN